jgi:hypothetical protein
VDTLHITQDDHGYWMLCLEREDGAIGLLAHQFPAPDKLIEMANELIAERKVTARVVIDPPRQEAARPSPPVDYRKPAPRKAGE